MMQLTESCHLYARVGLSWASLGWTQFARPCHVMQVHNVMGMGANQCDFGVLPGYLSFNVMKPVGERWQVRHPDKCILRDAT